MRPGSWTPARMQHQVTSCLISHTAWGHQPCTNSVYPRHDHDTRAAQLISKTV